jgi:hypothetical protein
VDVCDRQRLRTRDEVPAVGAAGRANESGMAHRRFAGVVRQSPTITRSQVGVVVTRGAFVGSLLWLAMSGVACGGAQTPADDQLAGTWGYDNPDGKGGIGLTFAQNGT